MRTPKLIVWILAILLVLSVWPLFFGQGGFVRLNELTEQYQALCEENDRLRQKNRQLIAEIESLKSGLGAIEEHARYDLNMVRPKEIIFRVSRPQSVVPEADNSANSNNEPAARPAQGTEKSSQRPKP